MLPQVIDCDKSTIFIFNDDLMNYISETNFAGIFKEKLFHIRRWHQALSKDKSTYSEPEYKNITHLKVGSKS